MNTTTTTPPRLRAKKVKKAPHNDTINQYSLINTVFNFLKLIRNTEALNLLPI